MGHSPETAVAVDHANIKLTIAVQVAGDKGHQIRKARRLPASELSGLLILVQRQLPSLADQRRVGIAIHVEVGPGEGA